MTEVVQLSVNGQAHPIWRTQRQGAQLYTASLSRTATNGKPVTVAYTYRVLVQRHGHLLYLDLPRLAKGLNVQFDYSQAGLQRVTTLDFIASTESARVEHRPDSGTRTLDRRRVRRMDLPAVEDCVCVV